MTSFELDVVAEVPQRHQVSVVGAESELPYPDLASVVFYRLRQTNKLRSLCLKLACGPWMSKVSVLMALMSTVCVGMYDPSRPHNTTLECMHCIILAFFMMEMGIKMVAFGLFGHSRSYLHHHANQFDLVSIFVEILYYLLWAGGVSFPVMHVLKPLRLVSRLSYLEAVVSQIEQTASLIGNALIVFIGITYIAALVGVQLWAGDLLNRCFLGEDVQTMYNMSMKPYFESAYGENYAFICSSDRHGMRHCTDVPPYQMDGKTCTNDSICINWNNFYNVCRSADKNPENGAISFDNIFYAWITIFQVVTMEGWSKIMYYVMDAHSFLSFIYFVTLTLTGALVVLNLCAAVIASQFSDMGDEDSMSDESALVRWLKKIYGEFLSWVVRVAAVYESQTENRGLLVRSCFLIRGKIKIMVNSRCTVSFNRLFFVATLLNILIIALEHHEQPQKLTELVKICNIIFSILFLVEMILRLLADPVVFFGDLPGLFDCFIVLIGLLEVALDAAVIRAFRVLRVVKHMYLHPELKIPLEAMLASISRIGPLCAFILLFIFISSVIGMHLFGIELSSGGKSRANFETLLSSMVTVFQLFTLADWNDILYPAMATSSPWTALYFVVVVGCGHYILFNVIVGIVADTYQQCSLLSSSDEFDPTLNTTNTSDYCPRIAWGEPGTTSGPALEEDVHKCLNWTQRVLRWFKEREEWSLYVLSPQNKFRVICQRVISHRGFNGLILFLVVVCCITIVLQRPGLDPESTEGVILDLVKLVTSAVFLVEIFFKILSLGLIFGEDSYCRSVWNIMDGVLVTLYLVNDILNLTTAGSNNMMGIFKMFRLLWCLHPLRLINRVPKLKRALHALVASVKSMWNVLLVCIMFMLFYGVLGVQLFKGTFYRCVGANISNIVNKTDCLSANYQWIHKNYNFDNLPKALKSLFVMFSNDGWASVMYDGVDAVGVDQQEVKNHNQWAYLFFISFMALRFILFDLIIGEIVEAFSHYQQEQRGEDEEIEEEEEEEEEEQQHQPEDLYYISYSPVRRWIHNLVTSRFQNPLMAAVIVINVLFMTLEHHGQPELIGRMVDYCFYVSSVIFILELLLKAVAFGATRFLKDRWNLMEIAVLLVSDISIVLDMMNMLDAIPFDTGIFRVCRAIRLAHVLKSENIRQLLMGIWNTLLQCGDIGIVFLFFIFMYAAVGVELFGTQVCTAVHPCEGFHRHANFKNFGMALLALYRVSTGDNWCRLLEDTVRVPHLSDDYQNLLYWISPIYFGSFIIVVSFILMDLILAVISENTDD